MPTSRSPHKRATENMANQAAVLMTDHARRYPEYLSISACADRILRHNRNRWPTWRDEGSSSSTRVRAHADSGSAAFSSDASSLSSSACALAGHALPTDQALAAWGHVEARARRYRQQGIKEYIDLLRVMAYLDLLNDVPADERIARWMAEAAAKAATGAPDAGP